MSNLFVGVGISTFYRFARPRYPRSAIDSIFVAWSQLLSPGESCDKTIFTTMKTSGLAFDVACGSGQLTELLGSHFSKVIASDISATQIISAKEAFSGHSNMEFHVGDCNNLNCPDSGADLITVAQALHWFDVPKFYKEVNRCLKPTGALALLCYGFCALRCSPDSNNANHQLANRLLEEYFLGPKYIGPYWDWRRALVDSKYRALPMYNEDKCIRVSDEIMLDLTLSQFVSYLKSQSAYHTYLETVKPNPESEDVLNVFVRELSPLLSSNPSDPTEEPVLPLVFPLTIIVSVN